MYNALVITDNRMTTMHSIQLMHIYSITHISCLILLFSETPGQVESREPLDLMQMGSMIQMP